MRVRPGPRADRPADRQPAVGRAVAAGSSAASAAAPSVVVAVDDQPRQQVVAAGEVAVDRRGDHAHLTGDGAQREAGGPDVGELTAGGVR